MNSRYSISWIYEEFIICKFSRNKMIDSWTAPFPVINLDDFDRCLVEAKNAINIKAHSQVSIAFESDLHTHSFLELPPMSRKDIEQYLARNIDKEKNFSEKAAWSYRSTPHGSSGEGVLLHIMPEKVLQNIIYTCEKHKLEPRKILPLTEIMGQHIPRLPSIDEGIIILVALFKQHVEIVVADGRGESYFVRELSFDWSGDNLQRLKLDIERTLLYSKQQYGNACDIWIMGKDAIQVAESINQEFTIPVEADPQSSDSGFWANEINFLPNRISSNFVPNSLRASFTRRAAIQMGVWAAASSVIAAIATSLITESMRLDGNQLLQQDVASLERKYDQLQQQYRKLSNEQEQVNLLLETSDPVPVWFLYDLGNLVPDSMFLSSAVMEFESNTWKFILEGANNPTLANAASELEILEDKLQSAPWNARVSPAWRTDWLYKLQQGKANDDGLLAFRMEGTL